MIYGRRPVWLRLLENMITTVLIVLSIVQSQKLLSVTHRFRQTRQPQLCFRVRAERGQDVLGQQEGQESQQTDPVSQYRQADKED